VTRLLFLAFCAVAGCAHAQAVPAPSAASTQAPALVVVVTVDQLRPEYLGRWRSQFTGGLKRLLDEGAVFSQAYQDHAITETAPGHASILSGRFPYSTGIAMNTAGVNTPDSPLLDADGPGASPFRFKGTELADWMKRADPDTRVLSVSRKDRGAILPIGRAKESVFWYALSNGHFTTSTWYADTLPTWVRAFNAQERVLTRYAGKSWTPILPDSAYAEPDTVAAESFGQGFVFPYEMPTEPLRATNLFIAFPFMDELTVDFALAGARAMALGTRGHTDLLAVSLSTTDAVGHRWGPDSREMHDQVLRLDRQLGRLFDSLTTMVGAGRYTVVLTADHSVGPSPEVRSSEFVNAGAQRVMLDSFQPAVTAAAIKASQASLPLEALGFDGFTLTIDRDMVKGRDREIRAIAQAFAEEARKIPGVMRADALDQLAKADTVQDGIARRWLHMFRPGGSVIAVVTLQPFNVFERYNMATHGSPHDYDAHVPLIFWGAPFRQVVQNEFVRVVDIAPTLAAMLGVRVGEKLDGRVLTQALKAAPE
jgi:arylsulfatase A-like enzyme